MAEVRRIWLHSGHVMYSPIYRCICLAVFLLVPAINANSDGLHDTNSDAGGSNANDTTQATSGEPSITPRVKRLETTALALATNADAWVRLGDALMQKSRETLDAGDYTRAGNAYERALELDSKNVQALLGMAWVRNSEHDFEFGRRYAEAALAIDPKLPDALLLLGDAAMELGDYDSSFHYFQQALDIHPDLSSYSRAAHLLWLTGNGVRARWLMQKAINAGGPHAENTAWCRAQLALMLFHNGSLTAAEQAIEIAIKETPRNPHVLAAAGRIKTAQHDYAEGIELYQKSVDAAPSHDALAALVDLYELTGRHDEAEAQFERVESFHADQATKHGHAHPGNYQLARFYADHDRHLDAALAEAKAAWSAYPNVIAADTLAWCCYKNGDYDQAAEMIRRALKHGTPLADIHFHAAMIYSKLGDRPLAQKHLYQALNLNPEFHPLQAQLASDTIKELSERTTPDPEGALKVGPQ